MHQIITLTAPSKECSLKRMQYLWMRNNFFPLRPIEIQEKTPYSQRESSSGMRVQASLKRFSRDFSPILFTQGILWDITLGSRKEHKLPLCREFSAESREVLARVSILWNIPKLVEQKQKLVFLSPWLLPLNIPWWISFSLKKCSVDPLITLCIKKFGPVQLKIVILFHPPKCIFEKWSERFGRWRGGCWWRTSTC